MNSMTISGWCLFLCVNGKGIESFMVGLSMKNDDRLVVLTVTDGLYCNRITGLLEATWQFVCECKLGEGGGNVMFL